MKVHFSDDTDPPTIQSLQYGPILEQRTAVKNNACLAAGIPVQRHPPEGQGAQSGAQLGVCYIDAQVVVRKAGELWRITRMTTFAKTIARQADRFIAGRLIDDNIYELEDAFVGHTPFRAPTLQFSEP